MSNLNRFPAGLVPVSSFRELLALGLSRAQIGRALAQGRLLRARRDVYVPPGIDAALLAALRIGGRLSCGDALAHLGAGPSGSPGAGAGPPHVALRPESSRIRDEHGRRAHDLSRIGAVLHWRAPRFGPGDRCAVDPREALLGVARCAGAAAAAVAAERAIRAGLLTRAAAEAALLRGPARGAA